MFYIHSYHIIRSYWELEKKVFLVKVHYFWVGTNAFMSYRHFTSDKISWGKNVLRWLLLSFPVVIILWYSVTSKIVLKYSTFFKIGNNRFLF